jgi:hypothetical protein
MRHAGAMPYGEMPTLLLRKPSGASCFEKIEENDEEMIYKQGF